jgi:DNA-directed RNA polymerase specialized sigma24 family protein
VEKQEDSVSGLLVGLKQADQQAAAGLWHRYFDKLVGLARRRLSGIPPGMIDAEDVALSVFKSLCLRAARDSFPQLQDRDDLWRILVLLTRCKAAATVRKASRPNSGAHPVRRNAVEQVVCDEPSPAELASLNDEREHLLRMLPDDSCRSIALRKMNGETDEEIAAALDIANRTVRRKTKLIRAVWEEQLQKIDVG